MKAFTEQGDDLLSYLAERFYDTTSAEVFCAFGLIMCIAMVVKGCCLEPLLGCCGKSISFLTECILCRIMGLNDVPLDEVTSPCFYQELNAKFLKELYIKSMNELRILRKEIQSHKINPFQLKDKQGNDVDSSIINVQHVEKMMVRRIIDIKKTINRLLINIHGLDRVRNHFKGEGNNEMEPLFKLRYLLKK